MGTSKTVTPDGVSDTDQVSRLTGYSIIEADEMDTALAMAESCPFLEVGTLEVGELMEMRRP